MAQDYQIDDLGIEAGERLEFTDADGETLAALDGEETDDLIRWLAEDIRGRQYAYRDGESV